MPDQRALPTLHLTIEATYSCGCGDVVVSDGEHRAVLEFWCARGHPSAYLARALEELLNYGGEAQCGWSPDQGVGCRWIFRRDGDALHVTILQFPHSLPNNEHRVRDAAVLFSMTCDLWKFAARVRLYESRIDRSMEESGRKTHQAQFRPLDGSKTLADFLEEHKRQVRK